MRRYYNTPDGFAAFKKNRNKMNQIHHKELIARGKVAYALSTGRLTKPAICEACSKSGRIEAHHADYDRPLDVEWLCTDCHSERRKLVNSKELIY